MYTDVAPADPTRLLRMKDVLKIVPVSRPTIYRLMAKGEFPNFRRIGSSVMWLESEVTHWVEKKRLPDLSFDELLGLDERSPR